MGAATPTSFTELGALPTQAHALQDAVRFLRLPSTVRERCAAVADAVAAGRSSHLALDRSRLPELARRVARLTRERYPGGEVPLHSCWRHFEAGGIDRRAVLDARLRGMEPAEAARARVDLAIVAVLLDGPSALHWQFREPGTGCQLGRAEGLGAAVFQAFMAGRFSSDPADPLRVDADALARLNPGTIGEIFQARADNPLPGLDARLRLLQRLESVLRGRADIFGQPGRPGRLLDLLGHVVVRGPDGREQRLPVQRLRAPVMLRTLIKAFGAVWPGGAPLAGRVLGDVWSHPLAGGSGPGAGRVPLHTMAQWLALSLVEPLASGGIGIDQLDELTGLAGMRHGGLFIDGGVIVPREPGFVRATHMVGDAAVVEWRALTVVLLDELARLVRAELGQPAMSLPAVLEGGVAAAGRELAVERRPGGPPPLTVSGFGTLL
ncbi:MAG: DUF1688 family protein [Rhodoferax sp.]|nr:DUF1688 family protein [Rhodoferax sp.]MCP5288331.1 DUF1688 family protein [Burkholderiaceae bacterium]